MCKAVPYGGQRCAYHTRSDYAEAIAKVNDADFETNLADLEDLEKAAMLYASTPEGAEVITTDIARAEEADRWDHAALLRAALTKGRVLAEANRATGVAVQQVRTERALQAVGPEGLQDTRPARVEALRAAEKALATSQPAGDGGSRQQAQVRVQQARGAVAEMKPGDRMVVTRGRKVPKGTEGAFVRVHEGEYGPSALLRTDSGETLWVKLSYLEHAEAVEA